MRNTLLVLAFLLAEAALLALGAWQWQRYHQRLAEQAAAAHAAPIELIGAYTPVLAALTQQPDPQVPEESGWRLYGVLNTLSGSVLINRGYHAPQWADMNKSTPNFTGLTAPSGTFTLRGVWADIPQRKGWLKGPETTTHPQLLAFLNPALITSSTLAPQQLVLTQPETPTSPLVPAAPPLANPLRHLSYAIQWLCMALVLAVLSALAWRKSTRRR
ncbi:MAG: SURF1 family cytochrome oxidase biogenesis protein [Pseudomonadota bacterium]